MADNPVPDEPDVTVPRGASLDDVLDVLARTNRGLLRVERTLQRLTSAIFTFIAVCFMILHIKARG